MDKILSLQTNQISIIGEPDHKIRKLIHIWCETNNLDPNYHRSFVNNNFINNLCGNQFLYYRCHDCHGETPTDTFRGQTMPQIDASYMNYGTCIKCGEDIQYDSGDYDDYDDLRNKHKEKDVGLCMGGKYWNGNNIMIFGSYIQKYFRRSSKKSGGESEEIGEEYLKTKIIYVIDAPKKPMSKAEFMLYVNCHISGQLWY